MSPIQKILQALETIQQVAGGSFLIVETAQTSTYGISVNAHVHTELYAILAGPSSGPGIQKPLNPDHQTALAALGWEPDSNGFWIRQWFDVSSPEDRKIVVQEILSVLSEILGERGDIMVSVTIEEPNKAEINRELEARGYTAYLAQSSTFSPLAILLLLILILSLGILFYFLTGPQ